MPSHPPYALISLTSVETNILSFNIIYFYICMFLFIRFLGSSNYIRIRDLLVFFEIEVTLFRKNLFSFSTVLGLTYALLHMSLVFFSLSSFSIVQFSRYIFWVKKNLISSPQLSLLGGDEENRTPDPLLARQVLSQLSYTPKFLFDTSSLQACRTHVLPAPSFLVWNKFTLFQILKIIWSFAPILNQIVRLSKTNFPHAYTHDFALQNRLLLAIRFANSCRRLHFVHVCSIKLRLLLQWWA